MVQNLGSRIIFEPEKSFIYRIQSIYLVNTSRISWECSSNVWNMMGIYYYVMV